MLATISYILASLAALFALGLGIVAVLIGAVFFALAGPDCPPIELPVKASAVLLALVGLLIFIAAANDLASVAMAA